MHPPFANILHTVTLKRYTSIYFGYFFFLTKKDKKGKPSCVIKWFLAIWIRTINIKCRVFKHLEKSWLKLLVSIITHGCSPYYNVWFVWFYSRTVRLTNCSLIQRSESHSTATQESKVITNVTGGISHSMEMNAVDQWRLRLLFTTTGHLGTLICCTVKTSHKALLESNYG